MEITKDNFYEKADEIKCATCGCMAEYFFEKEDSPLCESCVFDILKDECNELHEIDDLEDENEDDVDLLNKLWSEQEGK